MINYIVIKISTVEQLQFRTLPFKVHLALKGAKSLNVCYFECFSLVHCKVTFLFNAVKKEKEKEENNYVFHSYVIYMKAISLKINLE